MRLEALLRGEVLDLAVGVVKRLNNSCKLGCVVAGAPLLGIETPAEYSIWLQTFCHFPLGFSVIDHPLTPGLSLSQPHSRFSGFFDLLQLR